MWAIIGTWAMAEEGIKEAAKTLEKDDSALEACITCIKDVESNPKFTSVGYGGLPNRLGKVSLDAAVMDGDTLKMGSVMAVENYEHPCLIAKDLLQYDFNNVLVGKGAEAHAVRIGLKSKDLLTQSSEKAWQDHINQVKGGLAPYHGHDTICTVALDQKGSMAAVTSTSGLFYKAPGRVGDAPLPGSGFYVDSKVGGAAATGLGEDIMKGILSYEIVRLMKDGRLPQEACEEAVNDLNDKLITIKGKAGDLSVIALNHKGDFGAATNIDAFPFVVSREMDLIIGTASYKDGHHSQEFTCTKL